MIKNILFMIQFGLLPGLLGFITPAFSQTELWEKTSGASGLTVNSLVVDQDGDVFAGTPDGLFRSTDNGETWEEDLIAGSIWILAIGPNNELFASPIQGGLMRSTDNGDSWENTGIIIPQTLWAFCITSTGDFIIGVTHGETPGMYRSSDNGVNWTNISNLDVQALAVNSQGDIFAGTRVSGIYRSSDNGDSWSEMNTGLTNKVVYGITLNNSGDIIAGTAAGIFRSKDNGDNWTKVATSNPVKDFVINSENHIFAGISGRPRILRSIDGGESWSEQEAGLTGLVVEELAINSNDVIFVGTNEGVYRSIAFPTHVNQGIRTLPSFFALEQNYPNPFNPTTMISYRLSSDSRVKLSVFNLLGEEVSVLVNAWQSVGNYQVRFDAGNLPNGVYFYKIQASNFSETLKMLLMK